MPYISQTRRVEIDNQMTQLLNDIGKFTVGELNYTISRILQAHVNVHVVSKTFTYHICNNLMGLLECAKNEFYYRVVLPYENTKMEENGTLY